MKYDAIKGWLSAADAIVSGPIGKVGSAGKNHFVLAMEGLVGNGLFRRIFKEITMNTDYSNVDFDSEYEELPEQVVIMAKVDGDFLPIRRTRAIRLIPGGQVVVTSEVYRVERNGKVIEEATAENVVAKAVLRNQLSKQLPKSLGQAINRSLGEGNVTVQEDRSSHSESFKPSNKF